MADAELHDAASPVTHPELECPWNALPGFRILRALRTRLGMHRSALAVREAPGGFSRVCALEAAQDTPQNQAAVQALVHEAAFAARLRHPAVATVFDVLHPDGWVVVVRPIDGNLTLAHLSSALARNTNPLEERIVWHVAHTLFDCLDDVHHARLSDGQPMHHGDLRPGHLFVRSDGSVVIRGFGRTRWDWAPADESSRRAMYQTPECLAGEAPSPSADLYSAAMIVWELLVDPSACRDLQRSLDDPRGGAVVPPLASLRPDVPPAIAAAIDLCLSPDPDARSLSASAVATAIHRSADVLTGRELLARMHANVLARLQGKPNPRWSTAPSRPGGVDCAAPTLRLARSPAIVHSAPPLQVLLPGHPLCASPGVVAQPTASDDGETIDDELDTARWERDEGAASECESDSGDPSSEGDGDEVTWPQPAEESAMAPWERQPPAATVPISSFPPVAKSDVESAPPPALHQPARRHGRQLALALAAVLAAAFLGFSGAKTASGPVEFASPVVRRATATAASRAQPALPPTSSVAALSPAIPSEPIAVWRTRLTVQGPPEGTVFVQGVPVGETGRPLDVPCGMRYVRIGTPPIRGAMPTVRWLSAGRTMDLPCGEALERPLTRAR